MTVTRTSSSQTARVTLSLREMLLQGAFRPGERIREIPLAAKLGVSRIPLRLALERLAHEGLLEMRSTRGFVVQQFSTADIFEAIELRGAIEGMAARFAAEKLTDIRELAALREIVRQLWMLVRQKKITLDSFTVYIELNAQFHDMLMNLSRSRMLFRAMQQVCLLPFASPSAFLKQHHFAIDSREYLLIAQHQHQNLLDSIASGEGARAEGIAKEHARLAWRNLENALKDQNLIQCIPGAKLLKLS